jgi:hypothetical protein
MSERRMIHALLPLLIVPGMFFAQKVATKISSDEIKKAINQSSECDKLDQIAIDHIEYFD